MTNGEKFKTAEERNEAFRSFCTLSKRACNACLLSEHSSNRIECAYTWLDLEAKEEKPMPCPFCGGECVNDDTGGYVSRLICKECGYRTSTYKTDKYAIAAHNRVCKAVAAYKKSEVINGKEEDAE